MLELKFPPVLVKFPPVLLLKLPPVLLPRWVTVVVPLVRVRPHGVRPAGIRRAMKIY